MKRDDRLHRPAAHPPARAVLDVVVREAVIGNALSDLRRGQDVQFVGADFFVRRRIHVDAVVLEVQVVGGPMEGDPRGVAQPRRDLHGRGEDRLGDVGADGRLVNGGAGQRADKQAGRGDGGGGRRVHGIRLRSHVEEQVIVRERAGLGAHRQRVRLVLPALREIEVDAAEVRVGAGRRAAGAQDGNGGVVVPATADEKQTTGLADGSDAAGKVVGHQLRGVSDAIVVGIDEAEELAGGMKVITAGARHADAYQNRPVGELLHARRVIQARGEGGDAEVAGTDGWVAPNRGRGGGGSKP